MADDDVVFGERDAGRIGEVVRFVEHSPRYNLSRRRWGAPIPVDPTGGADGGGNSDGPCGCCNCLDCINACDAAAVDIVQSCSNCQTALYRYGIRLGAWAAFPNLGGGQNLDHVSGCVWKSEELTQSSGVYRWVFTQAKGSSTLKLEWVSGSDPVELNGGYRQVKFAAVASDDDWSCMCPMQMKAVSPDKFTLPLGLNCSVCVIPGAISTTSTASCGTCMPDNPCYKVDWPGIDGSALGCPSFIAWETDPSDSGFTMNWSGPLTNETGEYACKWETVIGTVTGISGGRLIVTSADNSASLEMVFRYTKTTLGFDGVYPTDWGNIAATFHCASFNCATGGTFTFNSDISDGGCATPEWPASLTVAASDCSFGESHADYGYGCGNSGGCSGCDWHTTFDGGVWTWHVTASDCGSCGNSCTSPITEASEGATAHTACAG